MRLQSEMAAGLYQKRGLSAANLRVAADFVDTVVVVDLAALEPLPPKRPVYEGAHRGGRSARVPQMRSAQLVKVQIELFGHQPGLVHVRY